MKISINTTCFHVLLLPACIVLLCNLSVLTYAEENLEPIKLEPEEQGEIIESELEIQQNMPRRRGFGHRLWTFAKGKPPDDAIYLGMWNVHVDGSGEYSHKVFGCDGECDNKEVNNMIGAQYKSIFAGTFVNSHRDQTYLLAVARNFVDKELFSTKARLQIGHRTGLIYGYGDRYPNLGGVSPITMATVGISYKIFGVELNWVPATPAVALNTRINIAPIIRTASKKLGRRRRPSKQTQQNSQP